MAVFSSDDAYLSLFTYCLQKFVSYIGLLKESLVYFICYFSLCLLIFSITLICLYASIEWLSF